MPFRPKKTNRYKRKAGKKAAAVPTVSQVKTIVKRAMSNVIETKHADYLFDSPTGPGSFYHDTWYLIEQDPMLINAGVGDSENLNPANRLGDEVLTLGLKYRLCIYKYNDRPNMFIRIMIIRVKPTTTPANDPTSHPQSASNIVKPVDVENEQFSKIMYDKTFVSNNSIALGTGAQPDSKFMWDYYLKLNTKTKYEDGSALAKNYTYRLWVCCYDTPSASVLDNVARFSYFRRHIYKDA